ncbi:MAG: hypothetical protein ACLRWP_20765 [Bilophila wadsworthia]
MHGYWSLVIFTLLGQAAAGMLILSFSRTADTSGRGPPASCSAWARWLHWNIFPILQ